MTIHHNISLKTYNTFSVDICCKQLISFTEKEEWPLLKSSGVFDEPFLFLGGGSNVLFTKDFDGTVLQFKNKGIELIKENEEGLFVKVAAGETWEDFLNYCIREKYYGVENLVGIPGWVGSAPVQNIGAYGVEVKDVIEKVEGIDMTTGKVLSLTNEECKFAYRSSVFKTELKNKFLITDVIFKLSRHEKYILSYTGLGEEIEKRRRKLSLQEVTDVVISLRNRKLPDVNRIGSAGSFFKNPVISPQKLQNLLGQYPDIMYYRISDTEVKLAAGKLIELCGWKGVREGDVGVYPEQALVIVNYGQAQGKDIVNFYQKIQSSVKTKFGVEIQPEVNFY